MTHDRSAVPRAAKPARDLRGQLIDAGIALLEELGPGGLTLRRAAARAGVSHAAPAHHFDGLAGLQTAIATRAFDLFTGTMRDHRDAAPSDPVARLRAICAGYLEFARRHGGLFHIMFGCPDVDMSDSALQAAADSAYRVLRDGCLPLSDGVPDLALETAVWSLVHGYASLGLIAPQARISGQARPDFDAVLDQLLQGR